MDTSLWVFMLILLHHQPFFSCNPRNIRKPIESQASAKEPSLNKTAVGPTLLRDPQIHAVRFDGISGGKVDHGLSENGVLQLLVDSEAKLRFFGLNLDSTSTIGFTETSANLGTDCTDIRTGPVQNLTSDEDGTSGTVAVTLVQPASNGPYFICLKYKNGSNPDKWIHQGTREYLQLLVVPLLLPLWVQIVFIIILQAMSGLMAGLTLGVLSLDPTELLIIQSVGTDDEKRCARHILPLRKLGNFLLCSLAIANVIVNSTLTILLDELTSGLFAIIFSTIGIVIFGEILPQAICSRYGLAIGSATRWVTKSVMFLTGIISWPLSKLLDLLLGGEIAVVYDRERLVELIKITQEDNQLGNDEINIISGTLAMKRKTAKDVMTSIDDVFMLSYEAVLDFDTLAEITKQGYTRIPVYEGVRSNVVSLVNIKDMALLDPDDCTAVKTLCQYYSYEVCFVFEDATLDTMLQEFRKGTSHMAFVRKIIQPEKGGDPLYEIIGVATLEDIIEEMIQAEIYDESDKAQIDAGTGAAKRKLSVYNSRQQYSSLITPQLQHAAYQFLVTSVDEFKPNLLNETMLRRLIQNPDSARMIRRKTAELELAYIYQTGKPADYFILILEGRIRVEIKVGSEKLMFESGPFTHFGASALVIMDGDRESASLNTKSLNPVPVMRSPSLVGRSRLSSLNQRSLRRSRANSGSRGTDEVSLNRRTGDFIPDFTVYAVADVLYLRIDRVQYLAAVRYSSLLMEKGGSAETAVTVGTQVSYTNMGNEDNNFEKLPKYMDRKVTKDKDASQNSFLQVPSIEIIGSEATSHF